MSGRFIPDHEVEITHFKGSGPGGQNRNKRLTGVRIKHLPTGIVAEATERRSQGQNLEAAWERLHEKVARFYFRPKKRVATKKSKGSQVRRVDAKRAVGQRKKQRSKSNWDD